MEKLRRIFQYFIKKRNNGVKQEKIMKNILILLRQTGIWSDSKRKYCEIVMFSITFFIVASLIYPELIYLFNKSDGISDTFLAIGISLGLISAETKHFIMFFKRNKLKMIINKLQNHYTNMAAEKYSKIIIDADKECQKLVFHYSVFLFFLSVVGMWRALFYYIYQEIVGLPHTSFKTPFKSEFTAKQPQNFIWYLYIAFKASWAMLSMGANDCTFVCLSIHLKGHLVILKKKLEDIGKLNMKKRNQLILINSNIEKETKIKLKEYILQHNIIIDYVSNMENIFSNQFLIDFNVGPLRICLMLFQVTIKIYDIEQLLIFLVCVIGSLLQLYMFAKYAEDIITESLQIAEVAYGCPWYNCSKEVQRYLILIMQRAQRPLGITAGKFYYISKGTITRILSAAVSYFTLLRAVREK